LGIICALTTVRDSFRRAWALRWPFLAAHATITLLATAIITPLTGLLVHAALRFSGTQALTDQDIAWFLLSPVGLVSIVIITSVLISGAVLGVAVMMSIDMAERHGSGLGLLAGLSLVISRIHRVAAFAALLVIRILLISAPFLIVAWLIVDAFLTGYDINYYLTHRPPEFLRVVLLLGVLLACLSWVLLNRLSAWSLALSGLLFCGFRVTAAFGESARLMQGQKLRFMVLLAIWAGVGIIAGAIVVALLGLGAELILPFAGGHIKLIAGLMLALLLAGYAISLLVSALTSGSLAIILVRQIEATGLPVTGPSGTGRGRSSGVWQVLSIGVVTIIAGLGGGGALLDMAQTKDSVEIIAHRGAAGQRPENTIASVRKAIEDGTDWIEIDVQETADGEIVVFHDSDLMKLAGIDLKIWDATMPDLAEIDIGSWFSPEFADARVPTLSAVLAEAKGRAGVLIELKYYGHDQQLEERVARIVDESGIGADMAVMSLKYAAVKKMKALRPGWRVGLLAATAIGDMTRLEADFLAVNQGLATVDFIRRAGAVGRDVYVWTVNDPVMMSRMISRGVSGLITDEPYLARQVLAARAELSTPERLMLLASDLFDLGLDRASYRDSSP